MQRLIYLFGLGLLFANTSPATAAIHLILDTPGSGMGNGTYATVLLPPTSNSQIVNDTTGAAVATALLSTTSSTTTSTFSEAGNGVLNGSFTQTFGLGANNSYGAVYAYFTVDANTPYSANATYANTPGGSVFLASTLSDVTTSTDLYTFNPAQNNSALVTMASNVPGFIGQISGMLLAGHTYYWDSSAQLISGSSGSGSGALVLGPAAAVPEAGSVAVWSMIAIALGGIGWYRRSIAISAA